MRLAHHCCHFLRLFMGFSGEEPGILDWCADDYYSDLPVSQANGCHRIFILPWAGKMDLFYPLISDRWSYVKSHPPPPARKKVVSCYKVKYRANQRRGMRERKWHNRCTNKRVKAFQSKALLFNAEKIVRIPASFTPSCSQKKNSSFTLSRVIRWIMLLCCSNSRFILSSKTLLPQSIRPTLRVSGNAFIIFAFCGIPKQSSAPQIFFFFFFSTEHRMSPFFPFTLLLFILCPSQIPVNSSQGRLSPHWNAYWSWSVSSGDGRKASRYFNIKYKGPKVS